MPKKKPQLLEGIVEFKNAGPIEGAFQVDVSRGPGLYKLTGAKATGKSTILKSLQLLQGHKVEVTIHDGEMEGHVAGWGVVAPLGPRRRPSGELELETLEGATFADFIQPQGKTGPTRDKACIQTLVQLTGVKADPSDYYELCGGREAYKKLGVDATDDPVVLAKRVKAKLEQLARDANTEANVETGHLQSIQAQLEEVDPNASDDLDALMAARDQAKDAFDRLCDKQYAANERDALIAKAREALEREKKEYDGPSTEEAARDRDRFEAEYHVCKAKVDDLEALLARAKVEMRQAADKVESAQQAELQAAKHERTIAAWEKTIAEPLEHVSQEELDEAQEAVTEAIAAYNLGVKVRDVRKAAEKAEQHANAAGEAKDRAEQWREAASQTFPILTQRLQTNEILIEQVEGEARLMVKHPTRRKKVFFNEEGDLSEGQRIMVAIKELLPRVKKPGLFDVPQHVFAGIQPADRKELHEFAVQHGIYLWGAVIDDGELKVEYGS